MLSGKTWKTFVPTCIKTTGEFITATIGSENAINRTLTSLKAALAIWISYRTAVLSVEAAKRANNVTTLAGLASIEASTVATVGLTGVTTNLSGAFNGLKVAFMSNPFGFVATAITSLISLFYAFKASTIEVSETQSIEAEALRKTNQEITNSIERVNGLTVGTEERKKATEALIAKYPELFKKLNAENITNQDLEYTLKKVHAQYREKIQLAILEAKNVSLLEKQLDVETRRFDMLAKLRERYTSESAKFSDDAAFLAELAKIDKLRSASQTISLGSTNLFGYDVMIAQAKALETESARIQKEITANAATHATTRIKIEKDSQLEMMKALSDRLAKGEISQKEYNKAIQDDTFEVVAKQVKAVEDGEDKKKKAKKSSLELSLENDLAELKAMEKTYQVKMQILNTEEKLKIEQVKRTIKDKEDQEDRILSI
jgi:hypothetical protein